MFYQPLVLNNGNWQQFKGNLGDFPVRLSSLGKLESSIQVRSVALKYVYQGNESYLLGKERYHISDNQFLLVNKHHPCEVSISHDAPSLGICIDLREDYFSDAIAAMQSPDEIDDVHDGIEFFLTDELYTQGMHASGRLQQLLHELAFRTAEKKEVLLDDFLRDITFHTISSQRVVLKEYNRLPAVKTSTKKELYTRLIKAKAILKEDSCSRLSVKEVGKMVCLSEFRFHHLFSKTFGTSPLQFRLRSVLQTAVLMHRNQSLPWTEIAEKTGFPDIQTFSKSFKKVFGKSPRNMETACS